MNQEQILSILYEMAMVMSAETRVEPLLYKTLQKLLYHTGFPSGIFITKSPSSTVENPDDRGDVYVAIEAVIGSQQLIQRLNETICVPQAFLNGKSELLKKEAQSHSVWEELTEYQYMLKLPAGNNHAYLLLSQNPPRNDLPLTQLFEPVLNNFAKSLQLCQVNESYTARLVEEREHAYTDLMRFRAALDTSDDCIFIIDPLHMKFIDFNLATVNALGYRESDLLKIGPQDITDDLSKPQWQSIFNRALNSKKEITEIVTSHRKSNGDRYPIEVRLSAFKKNHKPLIIAISRDITVRKKAEDELKAYKEHLQDLVTHRTKELEASNKELESYSYSIAHDLRAPLRSIVGFTQIIIEDAGDKLGDTELYYLEKTIDAGKRMGLLIDELLHLARISRASFATEKVNISKMVLEVLESLKATSQKRQVKTIVDRRMEAEADPHLIRLCIENLLGNSWKYTKNNPLACIEIGIKRIDKSDTFFIKDNGAGFDMRYAEKLFTPFQRLHSDTEFEGTGIGLATVQRIIEKHGGKVWAEAEVAEGATFYFTLQNSTEPVSPSELASSN